MINFVLLCMKSIKLDENYLIFLLFVNIYCFLCLDSTLTSEIWTQTLNVNFFLPEDCAAILHFQDFAISCDRYSVFNLISQKQWAVVLLPLLTKNLATVSSIFRKPIGGWSESRRRPTKRPELTSSWSCSKWALMANFTSTNALP